MIKKKPTLKIDVENMNIECLQKSSNNNSKKSENEFS